jgi:hypothetical protein
VRWQNDLLHLPHELVGFEQQFWVGTISPEGTFQPAG